MSSEFLFFPRNIMADLYTKNTVSKICKTCSIPVKIRGISGVKNIIAIKTRNIKILENLLLFIHCLRTQFTIISVIAANIMFKNKGISSFIPKILKRTQLAPAKV